MTTTVVRFRDPFPPHVIWAEVRASDITYGILLMEPATAAFQVSRSESNLNPRLMRIGAMVSIERDDRAVPYVGFVTRRVVQVGDAKIRFQCSDHVGALFERSRVPKGWSQLTGSSGDVINQIWGEVDNRAEPPLLVKLEQNGGPPVSYQPQAESFREFLDTMARFTGWEWRLRHDLFGGILSTALVWKGLHGVDRRSEVVWEQTRHFREVALTQDVEGFQRTALVIGGTGTVAARPAAQVSPDSGTTGGEGEDIVHRSYKGVSDRHAELSPALSGTRVVFDRQISNEEALLAAAQRIHDLPSGTREQLSPKLVETEIDMTKLGVGDIVTVRLSDMDMGSPLVRVCRILGLQFAPAIGIVDAELLILPDPVVGI